MSGRSLLGCSPHWGVHPIDTNRLPWRLALNAPFGTPVPETFYTAGPQGTPTVPRSPVSGLIPYADPANGSDYLSGLSRPFGWRPGQSSAGVLAARRLADYPA